MINAVVGVWIVGFAFARANFAMLLYARTVLLNSTFDNDGCFLFLDIDVVCFSFLELSALGF